MTVAAAAAKAGPYTGNDVTSSFAFSFKVFADADIRVVETVIATEVETDLVLNTNYTVSRNVNQDTSPGGTITYKVGGVTTALPSTKKLTIVGDFDYEQPTDIPDGGAFAASVLETALDRTQMQIKQLKEAVDRSVKVAVSSSTDPADLIADLTTSSAAAVAAATAAAISETNAGTSETNAAASAAAAAATLASALWRDVVFVTSTSSPVTIAQADNGKLYVADTTSGAITFNLPQVSGIALPFTVGVKLEAGTNSVTVNRAGTDTIGGATSKTLTSAGAGAQFVADIDPAPDVWTAVDFGLGDFAGSVHAATSKTTPVDADELPIIDSAASNVLKKLTWANLKATLFNGQIAFPATQSPSSDVNTLDDYEEGNWTPAASFSSSNGDLSHSIQVGKYVKVGKLVTVTCALQFSETTASGNLSVTGLPFTSDATTNYFAAAAVTPDNLTGISGGLAVRLGASSTQLDVRYSQTGSPAVVTNSNTGANSTIIFSLSYVAAA